MSEYDQLTPPDDYCEMHTGRRFSLNKPVFVPAEICWSLAFTCRFTGHCKRFYSVAEHCVLVADIMRHFNWGDPFEGLMHDGVESVLADINAPVKHGMLPEFCGVEDYYDAALRKQFGLPPKKTAECKRADWVALAIEAKILMHTGGAHWRIPDYARPAAEEYLAAYPAAAQLGFESFERVRATWTSLFNCLYEART